MATREVGNWRGRFGEEVLKEDQGSVYVRRRKGLSKSELDGMQSYLEGPSSVPRRRTDCPRTAKSFPKVTKKNKNGGFFRSIFVPKLLNDKG